MDAGLPLADDLVLPLEAVTQKFAFFAQSGAGNSYAAMKLADLMLTTGAQVVALAPVGIWWGLRATAGGLVTLGDWEPLPSGQERHPAGAGRDAPCRDHQGSAQWSKSRGCDGTCASRSIGQLLPSLV